MSSEKLELDGTNDDDNEFSKSSSYQQTKKLSFIIFLLTSFVV